MADSLLNSVGVNFDLNSIGLSSSQPNISIRDTESDTQTPAKTNKRPNPDSPEDLPGTAKQTGRQTRPRRNSLSDFSALESDKFMAPTSKPLKSSASRKSMYDKIVEAFTSPDVLSKIVPVISTKIVESVTDNINKTIEANIVSYFDQHVKPLVETVKEQEKQITEQRQMIAEQAKMVVHLCKTTAKNESLIKEQDRDIDALYRRIDQLEKRIENQEQYSRRTSLRFHNIRLPLNEQGMIAYPLDTDQIILDVCKNNIGIELQKEDIGRSHVIGNIVNGKSQIIVRFLSYRVRERVYNAKKNLKGHPDKVFVTENLTKYRTSLVKALAEVEKPTVYLLDNRRSHLRKS